jgi:chromosome segregation ATPase
MRRLLPGLILGSGGAALAVVFAGLWWRGEDRVLQAEQERDAAVAELTRASGAQARDRQSRTVAMVSSDEQLTRAHQEVSGLRRELEKAQAAMDEVREALAQAGKERDELSDQLSWQSNAGQQSQALLETERGRSETLALNLSQAQTELSSRAALHEQDVEELRSNVVSLRDEAAYRDIEVTNLISRAENQISSSQDEARQLQWKATDLESQLNSANAENTRLQSQVSSLESDLYTARQENVRLAACVERLECEVKILEKQLAQAIAAAQTTSGSGQSQSGGSGGASVAGHGG